MNLIRVLIAMLVFCGCLLTLATGKAEYSKKEQKACTFCHVKAGSKDLNDAGRYYQEHNHSLEGYKAPENK